LGPLKVISKNEKMYRVLLSVRITKVRNNAWEEKGYGVLTAVGAKVDEDEEIEFGILESFPNILVLKPNFLVRRVLCKSYDADFNFSTSKESRDGWILNL
jgi:hypothetical protein